MILHIAITTLLASMSACSDEMDPVLTQRDWDGTATYFQSADEHGFSMYYKPQVGFVGDPMPFYDPVAKDFKVMYLQDYRPNPEATYHPIFGVATKDGATYESLGELIPCGGRDEQDAAIGTGGTIYNPVDKLYYTFYTGNKFKPSSDQNAQVVMVATSPDFKTWTKNRTFYLKGDTYGYDKNDFRDPFLFQTEDGVYHMLIATRKNGKGHIAEFTSTDLKEWASAGTFMTMMWDRFYECPDVFKMGDWWYLVYSEQASFMRKVQYFKGKTLEELKATTANDAGIWPDNREGMLDSRAFYAGKTAADIVNEYDEGALADIFYLYGELKNSRRIASALVKARTEKPILTTKDFMAAVEPLFKREREKKDMAKLFQALRIEVNHEMDALKEMLRSATELLKPGGRLSVITYHSLEDRIVKNMMKAGNAEGKIEQDFFGRIETPFKLVNNKVIVPDADEQERNPRSRSAKLRIAEKK